MSNMSFLAFAMLVVLITLSWSQPGKAAPTWAKANPERAAKMKPGEYVTVTSGIDGLAYASSEYDNVYFAAEKAFGTSSSSSSYWMSQLKRVIDINSTHPIQLWFEFNERKRVTKIKFEEKYGLKSGQDYKIFASEAVGDCGNIKKQIVLATAKHGVFNGISTEFENKRSFRCYGIQTHNAQNYPWKFLALGLYKVMFGFEGQKEEECTPKLSYGCLSVPCCDGVACFEASGYMDYDKGEWIPATGKCLAYGATM